jgi:tetratricopeptide (TPR) repeat protein
MRRSIRRGIALFLFCGFFLPCVFAQSPDPALAEGQRLLEEARTTLDDGALTSAQNYFTHLTQQHRDNALYFYQLARADSYRSSGSSHRGEKKKAERALDDAMAAVQQALKLDEKSADAHSLLADLYGRKIGFGIGMFAGPKYGPKVQAENKRAQELDANNPRVMASLGRQYLEAPHMFGGDIDKAIASFRKSIELDPESDETYVWLAIALRKKGDASGAEQALAEALRLNSRSVFAKSTAEKH